MLSAITSCEGVKCLLRRRRVAGRLDQRRHVPVGDLLHQFGMGLEHVGAVTTGGFVHLRLSRIPVML